MPSMKRIERITIERLYDDSPDTSYLGKYSSSDEGNPYAIDRRHDADCATQTSSAVVNQLERVIAYLDEQRLAVWNHTTDEDKVSSFYDYASIDEAQDLLITAQEEVSECDCAGGDYSHDDEYAWFIPAVDNYEGLPEDEIREYARRDYERMEALQRGAWSYIGIRAKAEIVVNGLCQTITSGGLFGIEDDAHESEFTAIEQEQLAELRSALHDLGFSKRAIATAVKANS